jgi:hypothetical protein
MRPTFALSSSAAQLARAIALLGALGCSSTQASRSEQSTSQAGTDGGVATPDAGARPFTGLCGVMACEPSSLGTPGCCTRPGTGVPGHPLENIGRGPGLCGTDVGALVPSLTGTCLELDQPGEIDSECPAQAPLRGGTRMPGCCTDEGFCGGLETLIGFGCFYGTGRKGRPCTPGPGPDPDADAGS